MFTNTKFVLSVAILLANASVAVAARSGRCEHFR